MRHFLHSLPPPFLCVFDGSRRVIILPLLFFLLGQRDEKEKREGGDRGLGKRAKRIKKEREEWGTGDPWVLLGEEGDVLQERRGVKIAVAFWRTFLVSRLHCKKNRIDLKLN